MTKNEWKNILSCSILIKLRGNLVIYKERTSQPTRSWTIGRNPIWRSLFTFMNLPLAFSWDMYVIFDHFIPFLFLFCWFWRTKLRKCLFTFFKSFACLALQTKTIVKKITQTKSQKTKNKLTKICNRLDKNIKKSVKVGGLSHEKKSYI